MEYKVQTQNNKEFIIDGKSILVFVLVLLSIGLLWWGINQRVQLKNANDVVERKKKELMQRNKDLDKAETELGNVQRELGNLAEEWQVWLKDNKADLQDVAYWKGKYEVIVNRGKGDKIEVVIDKEGKVVEGEACDLPPDSLDGVKEVEHVNKLGKAVWLDTDGDGKPDVKTSRIVMNYDDYRIDISVDVLENLFNYTLHQNFEGEFVKATTGREGAIVHFMRIWELDDKGNRIKKIDLEKFRVITEAPKHGKNYWYWWNPKIDAGANISISSSLQSAIAPEFGLSLSTRGKTPNDNDWRLFRLSFAQNRDEFIFNFAPVCWNAGRKLPIVEDFYLCPTAGRTGSDTVLGIGMNTTF